MRESLSAFDDVYLGAVRDVLRVWTPEMQHEVASHNVGWAVGATDFAPYLRASVERYRRAYDAMLQFGPMGGDVCDVGGFLGAFAITLARLGRRVTMTERYELYSAGFEPLFSLIQREGVSVQDFDPFSGDAAPSRHDIVALMAVLEHYPHSLSDLVTTLQSMLRDRDSLVLVEVPNIAYWPRRVDLLAGKSPLPSILTKYRSRTPFTGHHHEFTYDELLSLADVANLHPLDVVEFNYSRERVPARTLLRDPRTAIRRAVEAAAFKALPHSREVLLLAARADGRVDHLE